MEELSSMGAKICAIGAGGGGCNTINRLKNMGILGAKTIAVNTDSNHLNVVEADKKVLIGKNLTKGLGAGGHPEIGKNAAIENKEEIKKELEGCDLVFLACGLGGGTGTGSAPVIAKVAKEQGSIVIAMVTLPFKLEGARLSKAEDGLEILRDICDTVVIVENQKLIELAGNMPLKEAFAVADGLMATTIKGITETISQPSLVNLDYADVKTIMTSGGVASIGIGEADNNTENRALEAVSKALTNPLLDIDYNGAKGALVQIIGGEDMTLDEISHIGEKVSEMMSKDATIMWGARIEPSYNNKIQVITIVTGVKSTCITGKSDKDATVKGNDFGVEIIS